MTARMIFAVVLNELLLNFKKSLKDYKSIRRGARSDRLQGEF